MFNQSKPTAKVAKKVTGARDSAVTILTSGCHFNGKLYCRGSSRIGGRIEGQIISEGLLIIEEEAVIVAEIRAEEAVIQGKVKGKLEATGRVELTATSQFEGDIASPILVVNEGAKFNGRSRMTTQVGIEARKGQDEHGRIPELSLSGKGDNGPDAGDFGKHAEVAVLKVPEVSAN